MMKVLMTWMQQKKIAPVISSVVPFEHYATAMDSIESRVSIGKVLLDVPAPI
jgi:NADPH:quinone reductase-like Zn-dependent oxidoreductase